MKKLAHRLSLAIDAFPSKTILVVGDLIADEFLYGQISRVSREAPVLVLHHQELLRVPGGAANAANNLLDLGCRVKMAGKTGRDPAGKELIASLSCKGADMRAVMRVPAYATPVKTRILARAHHSAPQQVVRIDRVPASGSSSPLDWESVRRAARDIDGIIVSDYGYGTVTPDQVSKLGSLARQEGIPIVVDSRFRMADFERVTSITPNITELEAVAGVSIGSDYRLLHKIAQNVIRRQKLQCLLVTQGRFGMTLFRPRGAYLHIPIFGSDEVADVTGAGDTVIAVFTLALACGAAPQDAARLANYAGGIVVMKRGTATLTSKELAAAAMQDLSG
jgi:rfaE bifunctional protein kinase chain/domain